MELQFRKCSEQDLDQLVAISKTTFIEAFQEQNDPKDFQDYLDRAFSKEKLGSELLNSNSSFYFVEQNNRLVGYLKLNEQQAQTEFKEADSMELERIYVVADFQGKGLGAQMLRFVLDFARKKQKDYVWLGVWEHNPKAIRFYERHGFQKIGTHPYYIGKDKQTDWLLKKEINKTTFIEQKSKI